jgi:hypothetical protein
MQMDIKELEQQFHGATLPKLVEKHLKQQTPERLVEAVKGTYHNFPVDQRPIIDEFTENYMENWFDLKIVDSDLGDIFSKTITDITNWSNTENLSLNDERAFDIFNIMVMKLTHLAHNSPNFRKMIGVKKGWFS